MPRSARRGEWPIHSLIKWSGTAAFRSTAKRKRLNTWNPPRFPAPCNPSSTLRWSSSRPFTVVNRCPSNPAEYWNRLVPMLQDIHEPIHACYFRFLLASVPNASPDMKYPAARFEVVGIGYLPGFGAKYIETEIALSRPKSASPCF